MSAFCGDECFVEIRKSIFRLETNYGGNTSIGTGFVIGKMRDSQSLVIATAKHVLDFPKDETVQWKVQQFNESAEVTRELTFCTSQKLKGNVPYRIHDQLDVGLCILPNRDSSQKLFAYENENPLQIIGRQLGASTGTRVAWSGFPVCVEQNLGFPQLCYFEGVISSMVNREDCKIYIVDGHAAPGVSGGPVWYLNEEVDRYEIIGIVCKYVQSDIDLPGFCFFEPINPVMGYLDYWRSELKGDFLITNCAYLEKESG